MINQEPVIEVPKQKIPIMDGNTGQTTNALSLASTIVYHIETGKAEVVVCADALELTSPNQIVVKAVKQYHDDGKPKLFQPTYTNDPSKCKVTPELIHPFSPRQNQLIQQERRHELAGSDQNIISKEAQNYVATGADLSSTNLPAEVAELETDELRKLCSVLGMTGIKASTRKKLVQNLSDYEDREGLLAEIENIVPVDDDSEQDNSNPNPQ